MFCKNCGNQIADNAAFCNACGAAQRQAPQQQAPQQPQYQQAQPQYQAPQQQYAPQPNYAAKANLLKSPFTLKHFTVFYVLSAVLSFMSLLFWFMPCISLNDSSTRMSYMFDEKMEMFGLHGVMFFFILAIIACLAGVALSLLPVFQKKVAAPSWFPLATAGIGLYNFVWTIIIAAKGVSKGWIKDQYGSDIPKEALKEAVKTFNDNIEKALTFGGWIFLLVSLALIAVSLILWAKQNKKF